VLGLRTGHHCVCRGLYVAHHFGACIGVDTSALRCNHPGLLILTLVKGTAMSAIDRVRRTLSSGKKLTARQITSRYQVSNPHDVIYRLRQEGMHIVQDNNRYSVPQS